MPAAVTDIYPLSALQEVWLADCRGVRRAEQRKHLGWQYEGTLDAERLAKAWQAVTDRHTALRSAFFWQGLRTPVQTVFQQALASIEFHDFTTSEAEGREERLGALLARERATPFDLTVPSLNRLIVVKLADEVHRLVWSMEGPLVDSWSQPIVMKELVRLYLAAANSERDTLPPPPPYRDFVAWRCRESFAGAEQFWRRELAPFAGATSVCDRPADRARAAPPEHADQVVPTDADLFTTLESIGARHGLTLNAVVMGAWAIVLAQRCRTDFVVFGITLSGRSPGVAAVERMVGYFMNVLPFPARILQDQGFPEWALGLQSLLVAMRHQEHLPATLPASWCRHATEPFLFDNLFVFENYPVQVPGEAPLPGFDLREAQGIVMGHFPLTIIVSKGWEWLQMLYDVRCVDHGTVRKLLRALTDCLLRLAASPHLKVGELVRLSNG